MNERARVVSTRAPVVSERWRLVLLWVCLALFVLRVIGQLEALLLAPAFLPPFAAWESGLIPYPLLLPVQILLIGRMTAIADQHSGADSFRLPRTGCWQVSLHCCRSRPRLAARPHRATPHRATPHRASPQRATP